MDTLQIVVGVQLVLDIFLGLAALAALSRSEKTYERLQKHLRESNYETCEQCGSYCKPSSMKVIRVEHSDANPMNPPKKKFYCKMHTPDWDIERIERNDQGMRITKYLRLNEVQQQRTTSSTYA